MRNNDLRNKNTNKIDVDGTKNATVGIGGDNKGNITNQVINNYFSSAGLPSTASIILAAISLLADLIALGQLAYNIIVKQEFSGINIVFQLIAITLVFALGYGLGIIGMKGFEKTTIDKVLQTYVWGYLILACLSYLGVIQVFRSEYAFSSYITYIIIIALQITAFMVLRSVSHVKPEIAHAVALMTVSVLHALIFLYNIIYIKIPDISSLLGEWVFWFGWTMFAVPMLRSAFRSGGKNNILSKSKLR